MSVNKVILVGRLGVNPELKNTTTGNAVTQFTLATNESWIDKNTGQKQDKTEWHRIVVWGKAAINCNQYLTKGSQVYLEGKVQTRQWQDKDNQTRYTTEIVANTVQFLSTAGRSQPEKKPESFASDESFTGFHPESNATQSPSEGIFTDEDIPF